MRGGSGPGLSLGCLGASGQGVHAGSRHSWSEVADSGRFTISGNPSPWEIEFSLPRTCTLGLPALPALASALVCLGLRTCWRELLKVPEVERVGVSGLDQPLTKPQPDATLPEPSSVEPHTPALGTRGKEVT